MLSPKRNLGYLHLVPYGETASKTSEKSLWQDKSKALKAAKDFRYGEDCYERINNAKSKAEVSRIMTEYRKRSL